MSRTILDTKLINSERYCEIEKYNPMSNCSSDIKSNPMNDHDYQANLEQVNMVKYKLI